MTNAKPIRIFASIPHNIGESFIICLKTFGESFALSGLRLILNGSGELQCGWKTVEIHGFPGNVPNRFFRVGLQNEYIF